MTDLAARALRARVFCRCGEYLGGRTTVRGRWGREMWGTVLVSALALLVAVGLLVAGLEWVVPKHRLGGREGGSRPVQLQQCVETPCLVP